jgi:ribonuclease HI
MTNYQIFVDGSCRGNKNGGIGIVWIKNGEKVYEYSKGFKDVTNNRMELLAIGYALLSIKKPIDSLEIVSDSEYALGCIFNEKWNPKKNVELIARIKKQLIKTQSLVKEPIKYRHVYGHQKEGGSDMVWNNKADSLAQFASQNIFNLTNQI